MPYKQRNPNYEKVVIERDPNLTAKEYQNLYRKTWLKLNRPHFNAASGLTYYKKLYGKEKINQYCALNDNDFQETIKSIKIDILRGKLQKLPQAEKDAAKSSNE